MEKEEEQKNNNNKKKYKDKKTLKVKQINVNDFKVIKTYNLKKTDKELGEKDMKSSKVMP